MADVKWIKIVTDIFDNKKIKQIECLPDGDGIIVIWFKLLCLSGTTNDNGMVYFTKDIPYTDQMLAAQFNRPLTLVKLALDTFERFGMIDVIDDVLHVSNWEKYQSVDRLKELKEYNRLAQQKSREKRKQLQSVNDMSLTSQCCQDTDIEEDTEFRNKEIECKNIESIDDSSPQAEAEHCPFVKIKDLYHSICVSYPKLRSLDGNRKKAVAARWRMYKDLKIFEELFTIAESSDFLKGNNDRNWSADFDWMMKPTNFAKILEGKYGNRDKPQPQSKMKEALDVIRDLYEEAQEYDKNGNYESSIPDFNELPASRQIER